MKITVASNIGFCNGVKKAIEKAIRATEEHEQVYMLGDIVHNKDVVNELAEKGVKVINKLEEMDNTKPVLFRAHGTKPEIWKAARRKKLTIIDATCPLVLKIHKEVKMLAEEGRQIIIIGDHGHEEVEAIKSQVANAKIIFTVKEAESVYLKKKVGVVAQSTQDLEHVKDIVSILVGRVQDLRFINTICAPTKNRQTEIVQMAKARDLMLIIGSETSANTKRLLEISKKINKNSYRITNEKEIDTAWLSGISSIGICAGASTPDNCIKSVEKFIKNHQNYDVKKN